MKESIIITNLNDAIISPSHSDAQPSYSIQQKAPGDVWIEEILLVYPQAAGKQKIKISAPFMGTKLMHGPATFDAVGAKRESDLIVPKIRFSTPVFWKVGQNIDIHIATDAATTLQPGDVEIRINGYIER